MVLLCHFELTYENLNPKKQKTKSNNIKDGKKWFRVQKQKQNTALNYIPHENRMNESDFIWAKK